MYSYALDGFMMVSTELSPTIQGEVRGHYKSIHGHFLVFRFTIKTVSTFNLWLNAKYLCATIKTRSYTNVLEIVMT